MARIPIRPREDGDGFSEETVERVPRESITRLFVRFLRFGFLAWGGPAAQIAMIRQELVEEERWISPERFNRVLAVYQALPGPEAHELCVYFGMLARGRWGGVVAGLGFMLPGFLLMLLLSWFYVTYSLSSPWFAAVSYGFAPAVAAILSFAVYRIGRHAVRDRPLMGIALASAAISLVGGNPLLLLVLAGMAYVWLQYGHRFRERPSEASRPRGRGNTHFAVHLGLTVAVAGVLLWDFLLRSGPAADAGVGGSASVLDLFVTGAKAGLLTFGGAYTAIAFLQRDAVVTGRWMSNEEFLDGLALHGILPAPAVIVGTFVGYIAGGPLGAVVVTAGIFLPAFSFTLLGHAHLERIVENRATHAFLDGVTAGVVGLIAVVAFQLADTALLPSESLDFYAIFIFALALIVLVLWRTKVSVLLAVGAGGALGVLRGFLLA